MINNNRLYRLYGLAVAIMLLSAISGYATAQDTFVLRGAAIETVGKSGRLEQGQILVVDGMIREVGETVNVPDNARIIDLNGSTVLPGIVDPYFVVNFNMGAAPAAEEREIAVGGRTFRVPGNQGRTPPVSFVRVADVFDARPGSWDMALRSGITTVNIVTSGYGQSVVGSPLPKEMFSLESAPGTTSGKPADPKSTETEKEVFVHPIVRKSAGGLYTTVTNDTTSLKTIRDGLKDPTAERPATGEAAGSGAATPQRGAAGGRGRGTGGGGPPTGRTGAAAGGPPAGGAATTDPSQKLWQAVRAGEQPIIVNSNNAAAILYLMKEHDKAPAARLAVVGSGSDWYQTMELLPNRKLTVVLPPRLDNHPQSRDRLNVPRLLGDAGVEFVFSLSTGQTDYRAMQHNPLFPVSVLMKSGLTRQQALEALTIGPAKLLGLDKEIGTIEVGKRADLVVFDADPFDASAGVQQVFIAGKSAYESK